jgi:hypothetical protein
VIFFDECNEVFFLFGRKFDEKNFLVFFFEFSLSDIVRFDVIDSIDAGSDSRSEQSLNQIFEFSSIIGEGGHCNQHGWVVMNKDSCTVRLCGTYSRKRK